MIIIILLECNLYYNFNFKFTAKSFTEFIPQSNLNTGNINTSNEINELKNKLNEVNIMNNSLKDKNKRLENENIKLKNELNITNNANNQLKLELEKLKNENKKLEDELFKAKKIINNFGNNNNNNEIMNLKYQILEKDNKILEKDNKIKDLEMKLLQNNKEINKPQLFDMFIFFESGDQVINHVPIECRSTDTVAEIEEKLYKEYNEFRNTNNTIICNGRNILRFKTLSENGIKHKNVVQIHKIE